MHRPRLAGGGLGQSLRRPPRRSAKSHLIADAVKNIDQRPHDGGFTRTGAAREHHDPADQRIVNGFFLRCRIADPRCALCLFDKAVNVRGVDRHTDTIKQNQLHGNIVLAIIGVSVIAIAHTAHHLAFDAPAVKERIQCGTTILCICTKRRLCSCEQLVLGETNVSVLAAVGA